MTALDKAIEIAGSAKKLSSMLGISRMAISLWKNDGKGWYPPIVFFPFIKQQA